MKINLMPLSTHHCSGQGQSTWDKLGCAPVSYAVNLSTSRRPAGISRSGRSKPYRRLPHLLESLELTQKATQARSAPSMRGQRWLGELWRPSPVVVQYDLSFLLGAPIFRCAEAFREVKDLAQARNCSLSFQEEAGTISFHRNETEPTSVDAIRRTTEEDCWHPQRK
jgi:hypothetical protein